MNKFFPRAAVWLALAIVVLSSSSGHSQSQGITPCANPGLTASAGISFSTPVTAVVDDFNNDGKPDIATGSSSGGLLQVRLGDGAGAFSPATSTSTSRSIASIASADFNGDGNKDLVVGHSFSSGVETIYLGNGAGGFSLSQTIFQGGIGSTQVFVATGDLNGDSKQDLVLQIVSPFGLHQLSVQLGDGTGHFTFSNSTSLSNTSHGGLKLTDLNGDSKLDVAAISGNSVSTLLGDGTGKFAAPQSFATGSAPISIVVGDFNGDSKKDAAVANNGSNNVSVLFGDGAGNLGSSSTIPNVGVNPQAIAKGDFDTNGLLDFVVITETPGTATLYLNQGSGSFLKQSNFFFGVRFSLSTVTAIEADFNLDSRDDLFVSDQFRGQGWLLTNGCNTVAPQINFGANVFSNTESIPGPPPNPASALSVVVIRVGDVTGSATVDYQTSDETAVAGQDYLSASGTLTFAPGETFKTVFIQLVDDNVTEAFQETFVFTLSNATGSSSLGTPNVSHPAIIDDDPTPQLNISDASITEGNSGTASLDFKVSLDHGSALPITVNYQTVDGSATAGSDYQSASGTLTFAARQVAQTISIPVNGDTSPEVTETFLLNLSAPTNVTILDAQAVGAIRDDDSSCPEPTFGPVTIFTVGTNQFDAVAADFNGDTKTDLVTANIDGTSVSLLLGNGNGDFSPATNFTVPNRPQSIALGDFNSDNKPDLVVMRTESNAGAGGISILLNDGAGGFSAAVSTTVPNLADVTVGDFNADNKRDLAILSRNPSTGAGTVLIELGDGTGSFGAPVSYPVGTTPMDIQVANLNGDNKPDLVVANQNSNNVSVLLNNGDGTFGSATSFSTASAPQALAVGDINSDGKVDVVVASSSGTTILRGDGLGSFTRDDSLSSVVAVRVILADFNGDNALDLALSRVDDNFPNPANKILVLFGNGAGGFTSPTPLLIPKPSLGLVAANFDSNPRLDLAFVQSESINVGLILNTCSLTPPGAIVNFSASRINALENGGSVSVNVVRSGNTQAQVRVDYAAVDSTSNPNCATLNGAASSRCDYQAILGTLTFAANETSKTLSIPLIDDSYAEGDETFDVLLSNPVGGVLGSSSTLTITIQDNDGQTGANPIDSSAFFVRQHYIDFLNREPDQSGLNFWVGEINQCSGDAQCVEVKRIHVSAAFFLSIEFQETGYLVERIYRAAYGDRAATSTLGGSHQFSVPIIRLNEFLADSQKIRQGVVVGEPNWEMTLETNKQQFVQEFVARSRFMTAMPNSLTPTQYVDQLNANAGNPLTLEKRDQFIAGLSGGQLTRAQVLRMVAEDQVFSRTELNRAFVLMQYFGYLRRNPDDAPDSDYTGYDFWLSKLNQFNGDFVQAEMVKAFISADEYRRRFGP